MDTMPTEQQDALASDVTFIQEVLAPIPGWLNDITAAATCVLLRQQDTISTAGGFVEIGVYGGKYLSLLARHAAQSGGAVLGLDTYHHFNPQQVAATVRSSIAGLGTDPALTLHKASSQDLSALDMRRLLDGPARLIHIDGSHDGDDVLWDLEISEPLLTPSGLLVLDDILSPHDVGVTEAFFRFQILRPRPLLPIAYVANKLFLSRHSHAAAYRAALERFLMADTAFVHSTRFRDRLKSVGRRMVETKLCGHPYLVVT
jgi:predicted O-methyltransferase YrrM